MGLLKKVVFRSASASLAQQPHYISKTYDMQAWTPALRSGFFNRPTVTKLLQITLKRRDRRRVPRTNSFVRAFSEVGEDTVKQVEKPLLSPYDTPIDNHIVIR